jgi:2-amino-4-hydroxy-6-hydroxymethyldihydropteridine diphosphokinase
MPLAWIALGSNLDDPPAQLREALRQLQQTASIALELCSTFYRSPPLGPPGQDDYCNAVCRARTELPPLELLKVLQQIEDRIGRVRGSERWGPRVIDLDLLLHDEEVLHSPELELPHPQLHRRSFVLVPLVEIAPEIVVPGRGAAKALLEAVGRNGVTSWPS